jgi:hypothetical protein
MPSGEIWLTTDAVSGGQRVREEEGDLQNRAATDQIPDFARDAQIVLPLARRRPDRKGGSCEAALAVYRRRPDASEV